MSPTRTSPRRSWPARARRAGNLVPILVLAALSAPLVTPSAVAGQEPPAAPVAIPEPGEALVRIELLDGSELVGRIRAATAATVTLETVGGARITVERTQIRSVAPARGSETNGRFWREDPAGTRLFFTSTGRSLRAGEGYVGTYVIVLPFVAFGITDRFTLAAGAPVLFGEFEPFYLAPKLQVVRTDVAQVALGTLAFFFQDESVGIAYGVGTFGSMDTALHVGVGFGYSGDDFADEPVGMVGGEIRVSPRLKLLTENYILPGEVGSVYSFGLRFLGGRLSTDVGIAGLTSSDDEEGGCCLPMVNFSYAFGGGR